MRVALLTSNRDRCGIARYSRDLLATLAPLMDVDLVPIHPWPPEGERLERLRAADVVHLQHEYSFWGTAFPPPRAYYEGLELFRKPGRLVITAHTVAEAETVVAARGVGLRPLVKRAALRLRTGLREAIEAAPFQPADRVIVHNPAAAGALAKRLDRPEEVQFWPMPVPEWNVAASTWGPLSVRYGFHGRRLVTIFGFVTPEKDYGLAFRAIIRVQKQHPDATLVIAGGARDERKERRYRCWPDRWRPPDLPLIEVGRPAEAYPSPSSPAHRKLLSLFLPEPGARDSVAEAVAQNIGQLVRDTGYLSDADARTILEQTDVALLPYRSATASYAAGAALAAGCPLLTSDLPAFAEPLPALRYRPGDVEDLTEKLNLLLGDDLLRARLMARSGHYAEENSWARAAERHAALYQELTARV
jgi:glycosyltransferase involved in cell wall biosynthesis